MARIVVRNRDAQTADQQAQALRDHLDTHADRLNGTVRIHGPMPCPIARIAEHHRRQIELIASEPGAAAQIQGLLTAMRHARLLVSDARTAVDVDPVALM